MKPTTFALGALLASVAVAQPHKQHLARHHKRANAETTVVVTDWVYEYETVGVTTTVWVSPGFVEPEVTSSSTPPQTTSTPQAASTTSQTAAQFFQPESTSSTSTSTPTPTPTPSSSSVSSSTPSSVYVPPTTSTSASVYVAPVESSTSIAPVVIPTTTAPAAVAYTPPAETTTSAAPAATSAAPVSNSGSSSSSSSGVCSSSSPCTGDITFYTAGLGACGETTNGDTDKVVALPYELMGTQSNGNPYCGKTITISYGGKSTTATVVDKCMGCKGDSIDLSNAAFQELAEFALGRGTGAKWYFN
ncbi:hypothetical protein EG329_013511 [Mollisiaceae sp. DMI_Dod_QoI]|nr:hypothetical protein EG329_013511 [Helotiales sp. DMI_Dod_QoI]